jgi:hypothetical protein
MRHYRVTVRGFDPVTVEADTIGKAVYAVYRQFNEAYPTTFREFLLMVRARPWAGVA